MLIGIDLAGTVVHKGCDAWNLSRSTQNFLTLFLEFVHTSHLDHAQHAHTHQNLATGPYIVYYMNNQKVWGEFTVDVVNC